MRERYGIDIINFWLNGIYALVSLLTCSTLLFLICAKKSHKRTPTFPCNQDWGELEPSVYPRPSATYKDILSNPKKTDLIRQGKLKVDKKDPDYDTMADIDRELSLEKMDESQKSDETHIYETLCLPVMHRSITPKMEVRMTPIKQPSSKPEIPPTPLPRRESNPLPVATDLPSKMHTASKTKIVLEDPTQQVSFISLNEAEIFEPIRLPKAMKGSKTDVAENEQRRRSLELVKIGQSKAVGGKVLKPTKSSGGTNVWDKTKSAATMKNKGTKIVYSQYVKG